MSPLLSYVSKASQEGKENRCGGTFSLSVSVNPAAQTSLGFNVLLLFAVDKLVWFGMEIFLRDSDENPIKF